MDGFIKYNNISVVKTDKFECILKADITENSLNPYGIIHGGLIFSLGDTVMGTHVKVLGRTGVTLNASVDYLAPGKGKVLTATSEVIKMGSTTAVLRACIKDENNKLIATMGATYYFLK